MRRDIAFFVDDPSMLAACTWSSPTNEHLPMSVCLIAVGSNQGDSRAKILDACNEIGGCANTRLLTVSALLETAPVGPASKRFLNGCLLIETSRSPQQLMRDLLDIESSLGRQRITGTSVDRTIDLDVLLYADQIVCSEIARIPHPRMTFRRFVLEPAVEIAADMRHPLFDASMNELLMRIGGSAKLIVVVSSSFSARPQTACVRSDGWTIEYTDPFGNDESLDLFLQKTNLLIETVGTPAGRPALWRPDYRGPRWQVGSDFTDVTGEQFEWLIQTAIESMSPLS